MEDQDHSKTYSIGYVSRACGIPSDTIRTWERRYDYPVPVRLESGHRRYTADTIERLCLVREAIGSGIRPARALRTPPPELREMIALPDSEASSGQDPHCEHTAAPLASQLRTCLLAAEQLREDRINDALSAVWGSTQPLDFLENFLMPLIAGVGERWESGELGIAHEHCVSSLAEAFLASKWRAMPIAGNARATVVCTTLPKDRHSLAVHGTSLLLRERGVGTLFLGTDTPLDETVTAARQTGARAVVIGISGAIPQPDQIRGLTALRRALPDDIELCYGGPKTSHELDNITYLSTFLALDCWAAKYALPV